MVVSGSNTTPMRLFFRHEKADAMQHVQYKDLVVSYNLKSDIV